MINELLTERDLLREENQSLKTLLDWAVDCDFGFDNIADDWVEKTGFTEKAFDKECDKLNLNYNERLIHFAKLYNKKVGR